MKIMIVISRFDKCGPNRELLSMIREMLNVLIEVCVLTLYIERQNSAMEEFQKLDIDIKQANITSNRKCWSAQKVIREYEKEWNPDVVYCYGLSACFNTVKAVGEKKIYCTLHNNAYFDLRSGFGSILGKVGEYLTDYYVKRIDYNICCSKTLQKIYQKRFKDKKIYCIQNGINMHKFCVEKEIDTIEKIKKKLNIENKVVFLVSGSLDARKDPITIIKAFQGLKLEKFAVLIFVGTGTLETQCRTMVKEDNIIFAGFVNEVEKFYQMADVYISASHSEGLPNSVLEAGACGCRMLLSDIPQHREIFENEFDGIHYFRIEDDEELSRLIKKNLRETLMEEKEKISEYIGEHFSDKKMGEKYCEFFLNTVKDENV